MWLYLGCWLDVQIVAPIFRRVFAANEEISRQQSATSCKISNKFDPLRLVVDSV